jgi:hypothetical protein
MRQKVSASLKPDFADNTSATAAPTPYKSNWGGRGGCLGFFEHLFSLAHTDHCNKKKIHFSQKKEF